MASPPPGEGPYNQSGYPQESQGGLDHGQQATPAEQNQAGAAAAAGRRKRQYAGQAYEFGGGANAALGGQQPGGGAYPPPPGGGYPAYGQQQQQVPQGPQYGSGPTSPSVGGAPGYGQQQPAVGGYQAPEQTYPAPGAPMQQPGMAGVTADMGRMSVSGPGPHQPPGRQPMNQLYPTDLLNTTLNVAELDLPPPPIILPPNVRLRLGDCFSVC